MPSTLNFFGPLHSLPYALPVLVENTWRRAVCLIGPGSARRSPDWRSLARGRGIREALVRDRSGGLLAVYTAEIAGVTYVLHSVRKKAWKTGTADVRQAVGRFDSAAAGLRHG